MDIAVKTTNYSSTALSVFTSQRNRALHMRTENIRERKERIRKLAAWIKSHRSDIHNALKADLHKPEAEADVTEILPVLTEIRHTLDHLGQWVKPRKVDAPLTLLGTRSVIQYEPRGVCLIISPWNYPFNLSFGPLVSALAAGNTAIIKPSEFAPHTAKLVEECISSLFPNDEVAVFAGGSEVGQALLALPFDHIFFTGSPAVGKMVMRAAADHLTSVTLELGGKSPAIVSPSASIAMAARRIAVAKFINNGQTCIAPDYVIIHESRKEAFAEALKKEVDRLFGATGASLKDSPHYARIVNHRHFERLQALLNDALERGAKTVFSGPAEAESLFMHPVIISDVPEDARIMEEEIFGPILPVLTYSDIQDAIRKINNLPKPLALYYFGSDTTEKQHIVQQTSSGAVCVNDCAIHFLHTHLPFGGINHSGMGKAHGFFGFQTFSHEKPVLVQRKGLTTVSLFYPPYTDRVKKFTNWLLRMF